MWSALTIKLLRDIRRLWAQALAIAFVLASGVATMLLGVGTYDSLSGTRDRYYEEMHFADVFAHLTRAPKSLLAEVNAIEGVVQAEARISKVAIADIEGMEAPASVQLVSIPDIGEQKLNRVLLRSGRLPATGHAGEAVISETFAKAHGFTQGSHFKVLMNGRLRELTVAGIGLSPEFIYAVGPGEIMPDDKRFGIVWMREAVLANAYDLKGAFSNLAVKLFPGASEAKVISKIDALLARYGGTGAYGRKDQFSHSFIDAELRQLQAMSRVLPPIFVIVSAFLVNMTLSRLITLEKEIIGLLKAMGYSSRAVGRHYLAFATLIAVGGVIIGFAAGTWLGVEMAQLYVRFFHFPYLVFTRDPAIYALSAMVALVAAWLGAGRAVYNAARLPPATAMAPPAPASYKKSRFAAFTKRLAMGQPLVMVGRHLFRWPWRTLASVTGISFAVSILVGSLWAFGSTEFMIDLTFQKADRQFATIAFPSAKTREALHEVARLPGVLRAEPYRAVAARIQHEHVHRRVAITGKTRGADLSRLMGLDLKPVTLPESGIALSDALAGVLNAKPGDQVQVTLLEGDRRSFALPVTAIIQGYLGLGAYMDITALNRALREGPSISGAHIAVDEGRLGDLFATLKTTPAASQIALLHQALKVFRATLAENILTMISVYTSLAAIIAFGVVYNFARISLSEQGRELASLRVLGFTRGEVSALLLRELAIVVLAGQIPGWLMGYGFAVAMARGFSTELYRVPLVVGSEVYAAASLVVFAAAGLSALVVRRRIDRLDMIEVLKTRE